MKVVIIGAVAGGTSAAVKIRRNDENAVQNILMNNGFKKVYNISGGHKNYKTQTN